MNIASFPKSDSEKSSEESRRCIGAYLISHLICGHCPKCRGLYHIKASQEKNPASTSRRKLPGALQLIGGSHLAQEVLYRMAELLGLARQIA